MGQTLLTQRNDQASLTVGGIADLLLSEAFDRSRVTALRHVVAARAGESGLGGDRLDDFVVAVNELLTNAVRHGGGTGHVAVWCADDAVVCEVSDQGVGLGEIRPDKPAPDEPGGWGLYLVRELTDTFEIKTGPHGTAVRISSRTGNEKI
jgi:serine/threonine-protein kinase RsbW